MEPKFSTGCLVVVIMLGLGVWQMISPIGGNRPPTNSKEYGEWRQSQMRRYSELKSRVEGDPEKKMLLSRVEYYSTKLRRDHRVAVSIWDLIGELGENGLLKLGQEIRDQQVAGMYLQYVQKTAPQLRLKYGELPMEDTY